MCTIEEVLATTDSQGYLRVYTDLRGLSAIRDGNSFYVWTEKYVKDPTNEISVRVIEKDIAMDSRGRVYVVDPIDVEIISI